mmetsp:Transcript_46994/g.124436  ORF Transcript_46994/g.124436 Transcript_46994/m.124436 type:complete len:311 (-) Transcript_46994:2709-3641(-)
MVRRQPRNRTNHGVLRHLDLGSILGQCLHGPIRVVHPPYRAEQDIHLPALDDVRGQGRRDLRVPTLDFLHKVTGVRHHVPGAGSRSTQRRAGALLAGVGSQNLQNSRRGVHESQLRKNFQHDLLRCVQGHSEKLLLRRSVPQGSLATERRQAGHLPLVSEVMVVPLMLRRLDGYQALQELVEDLLTLTSQVHGKQLPIEEQQVRVLPLRQLHHALILLRRLTVQVLVQNLAQQVAACAEGVVSTVALLSPEAVEDVPVIFLHDAGHALLLRVEVFQNGFEQWRASFAIAGLADRTGLPHHPPRRRPPGRL